MQGKCEISLQMMDDDNKLVSQCNSRLYYDGTENALEYVKETIIALFNGTAKHVKNLEANKDDIK